MTIVIVTAIVSTDVSSYAFIVNSRAFLTCQPLAREIGQPLPTSTT